MTKVIAFAASTSTQSINKKLVAYTAGLISDVDIEVLDLNDYELPLFSADLEKEFLANNGHPQAATDFLAKLHSADAIIISFAEHNGSYTAAFKNLFDWCSRQGRDIYANKPMLLISTSNGARGAKTVLQQAVMLTPRYAGDVRASVSVPMFSENFDTESGQITNPQIDAELQQAVLALMTK